MFKNRRFETAFPPTPRPSDPCRDRPWETILKEWREIADWIGWQLKDTGAPGTDVAQNSFEQIETILAEHGFARFPWYKPNLNPGHGYGFHFEGQLRPKEWYHVVIHPAQDDPRRIPSDFRTRPASTIEIHCEQGFRRPSSIRHALDVIF